MRTARIPGLPYHRVIAAGGRLGGYGGNEALKRALLAAEGVQVSGKRVRDFDRKRFVFRK
jgi:alkylated DNA nucleotide flippase Atl1